ncbi:hypothetical protein BCR39DRAFT_337216 [Naematelia encephala]|uniref:Uncharacterized protein n=1 Tax=Naematelia encephala TaxID=71784 RepID=A0A1Y2AND3_9TREE|nr:hypothetical protein BCR39DRAFT_337216 [Naematelia encephala]
MSTTTLLDENHTGYIATTEVEQLPGERGVESYERKIREAMETFQGEIESMLDTGLAGRSNPPPIFPYLELDRTGNTSMRFRSLLADPDSNYQQVVCYQQDQETASRERFANTDENTLPIVDWRRFPIGGSFDLDSSTQMTPQNSSSGTTAANSLNTFPPQDGGTASFTSSVSQILISSTPRTQHHLSSGKVPDHGRYDR